MCEKWYSQSGEDDWINCDFSIVDDWHEEWKENGGEGVFTYFEADGELVPFEEYFRTEDILCAIEERGYGTSGELFDDYIFVKLRENKAAMKELSDLVHDFLKRHKCSPDNYYKMVNVVEKEWDEEEPNQ